MRSVAVTIRYSRFRKLTNSQSKTRNALRITSSGISTARTSRSSGATARNSPQNWAVAGGSCVADDEFQPFIGPQPFSEEQRDRFFGRKRETAELVSLVISHPAVFFYGQSGTGKTSLLHAGLIPSLAREEGFEIFPVARPGGRVNLLGADETTASPYVYSTLLTWSGAVHGSDRPSETNLADYLAKRAPQLNKYGEPSPRLLIFDQLEELFTDQIDVAQEQQEFFEQIGELLDASRFRVTSQGEITAPPLAPTRVLLAM